MTMEGVNNMANTDQPRTNGIGDNVIEFEKLTSVNRLSRDLRAAGSGLAAQEVRYLVDAYYQMQEDRIRASGRVRAMQETGEPHSIILWLEDQASTLENQLKGVLDVYSRSHPVGRWMRSNKGIGPVLASGYLARIDISRCNTAGKLWAYCGVAPGRDRRVRGEKINFNPAMKRLVYLTGECFKRLRKDDEEAYYRHIYDHRKEYELALNEKFAYRELAEKALSEKKYGDDTEAKKAYKQGKLPLGRIDQRAMRYAAKLFLSHLQEVWWWYEFKEAPPNKYVVDHLGHVDIMPPPGLDEFIQNEVMRAAAAR